MWKKTITPRLKHLHARRQRGAAGQPDLGGGMYKLAPSDVFAFIVPDPLADIDIEVSLPACLVVL